MKFAFGSSITRIQNGCCFALAHILPVHFYPTREEVRNELGLNEGDQFVVIGQGDAVILKVITPPKFEEFQELLRQARAQAKKAGVKKADLKSAIAKVRRHAK